jgi:hypothetical protein
MQIRGAQLVLTRDYDTGALIIAGQVRNTNEGLAMLAEATRELEYRWRAARAAEEISRPGEFIPPWTRADRQRG